MHLSLGLSEQLEDGDRMRLHVGVERRTVERGSNVGPCPVGVVVIAMAARRRVQRRRVRADGKPAPGEDMVAMGHEPAFGLGAKIERRDRLLDVRPVFGKGVKEGRDEHVAGQAAERIEMNVQKALPIRRGPSRSRK